MGTSGPVPSVPAASTIAHASVTNELIFTVYEDGAMQPTLEYSDRRRTGGKQDEDRIIAYLYGFYVEDNYVDFAFHTAVSTCTAAQIRRCSTDYNRFRPTQNVKRADVLASLVQFADDQIGTITTITDGIDLVTGRVTLSTGAYDRIETDTTITSIDVLY